MKFNLFNLPGLEQALDNCSLRNTVISSNIAHASVEGYSARKVVFEEQLQSAMKAPGKTPDEVPSKATVVDSGQPVDIISEMASLSKNQILYHAYADRVSAVFKNLSWIIDNSGR